MWKHVVTQAYNRVLPCFKNIWDSLTRGSKRVIGPVFRNQSRLRSLLLLLLFIGLIFLSGQILWIYCGVQPTLVFKEKIILDIPMGSSIFQIGRILEEKGLIKNRDSFVWYVYLTGRKERLKAGHYSFDGSISFHRLVKELETGRPIIYKITIPEGYTAGEIGLLLSRRGLIDLNKFQELLHDKVFLNSQLTNFSPSTGEGFLFPDTYEIAQGASEEEILRVFFRRFRQVWAEISSEATTNDLSPLESVILASVVEKEAKVEEERPVIAGVFLNRLQKGRLLQSCATVQYALGERKQRLLYEDLEIDSPYNTYRYKGLPPSPISNPGRASLAAVLHPTKTDYLYFVAKTDGSHVFSRTYREHLKAQSYVGNN